MNLAGTLTIPKDAELTVSDGTTLVTGQTTCQGTVRVKNGSFIPQGGFSGGGEVIPE
jgi:hypothetical protein